jgi:hypothetical protein
MFPSQSASSFSRVNELKFRPVTPAFVTFTNNSQLIQRSATLGPFLATLARSVTRNPFVCHSCRRQVGVGSRSSDQTSSGLDSRHRAECASLLSGYRSRDVDHGIRGTVLRYARTLAPATPFLSLVYFTVCCIPRGVPYFPTSTVVWSFPIREFSTPYAPSRPSYIPPPSAALSTHPAPIAPGSAKNITPEIAAPYADTAATRGTPDARQ